MNRLGIRLIIITITAVLLTASITGYFAYSTSEKVLRNKLITSDLKNLIELKKKTISSVVKTGTGVSLELAGDPILKEWIDSSAPNRGDYIKSRLKHISETLGYPQVFIIGRKGELWNNNSDKKVSFSLDDPAWFWFSNMLNSGKRIILDINNENGTDNCFLFFDALAGDLSNPYLVGGVGISLNSIIESFLKHSFGSKGRVLLINKKGEIEISRDKKLREKSINQILPKEIVQNILSHQADSENEINNLDYTDVNGMEMSLAFSNLEGTDWIVIIQIPQQHWLSSTLSPIARGTFYSVLCSILAVLVLITPVLFALGKKFHLVAAAISGLGNKNFSCCLPDKILKRKDELGDIGRGYEITRQSLSETLSNIISEIAQSSKTLSNVSAELSDGSDDMKQATGNLSSDMYSGAATMTQTASAVHQIASSIQEITKEVKEIDNNAKQVEINAVKGEEAINEITMAMLEIDQGSLKIGKIIDVITDISNQTNLLSLNAAIEAAKAGEAGKGFSVVAEEVRNLAMKSKESVIEIQALIQESSQNINNGYQVTEKNNQIIATIIQQITDISEKIRTVNLSINEQNRGIQELSRSTENITEIFIKSSDCSKQISINAEDFANTSGQLHQIAEKLNLKVSGFKF